jgi:hypothetical protein
VYVLLSTYTALRLSQICGGLCQTRKTPTLAQFFLLFRAKKSFKYSISMALKKDSGNLAVRLL